MTDRLQLAHTPLTHNHRAFYNKHLAFVANNICAPQKAMQDTQTSVTDRPDGISTDLQQANSFAYYGQK